MLFGMLLPLLALLAGPPAIPSDFTIPPVLMYHRVDPKSPPDAVGRQLTVVPDQFRDQLAYLRSRGIAVVSIAQFERALARHQPLERAVVMTFDDGYADQFTYALPLLERYDATATFYIVTGELGAPRHLNWRLVERLSKLGMDVAAHGVRHEDLSEMSRAQQLAQIDGSIEALREHLHVPIDSYAYPSGRFNRTTLRLVQAAGVPLAVTTDLTYVLPPENRFEVTRLRVRGDWKITDFAAAITAALARPQHIAGEMSAANGYPPGAGNVPLTGTITAITGTRLILRQDSARRTIAVDDRQALDRGGAQNLYVGRKITAWGFWSGGIFRAMIITEPR